MAPFSTENSHTKLETAKERRGSKKRRPRSGFSQMAGCSGDVGHLLGELALVPVDDHGRLALLPFQRVTTLVQSHHLHPVLDARLDVPRVVGVHLLVTSGAVEMRSPVAVATRWLLTLIEMRSTVRQKTSVTVQVTRCVFVFTAHRWQYSSAVSTRHLQFKPKHKRRPTIYPSFKMHGKHNYLRICGIREWKCGVTIFQVRRESRENGNGVWFWNENGKFYTGLMRENGIGMESTITKFPRT